MSKEMVVHDQDGVVIPSNEFTPIPLNLIKEHQSALKEMMRAILQENVDFGIIPGTNKPSLWKPGAEKILSRFRIHVGQPVIEDMGSEQEIRIRVMLPGITPDGICRGFGIGECSSFESKYRWRKAVCQEEYDETDPFERRKKWNKDGTYQHQIQTSAADLGNTILKMAKKRAIVDLAVTATAASDFFSQDFEDESQPRQTSRRKKEKQHIQVYEGIIKNLHQQPGKTGNKTWIKFGIQIDDDSWINTFSEEIGQNVMEILDSPDPVMVRIEYTTDKYGKKVERFEVLSE